MSNLYLFDVRPPPFLDPCQSAPPPDIAPPTSTGLAPPSVPATQRSPCPSSRPAAPIHVPPHRPPCPCPAPHSCSAPIALPARAPPPALAPPQLMPPPPPVPLPSPCPPAPSSPPPPPGRGFSSSPPPIGGWRLSEPRLRPASSSRARAPVVTVRARLVRHGQELQPWQCSTTSSISACRRQVSVVPRPGASPLECRRQRATGLRFDPASAARRQRKRRVVAEPGLRPLVYLGGLT